MKYRGEIVSAMFRATALQCWALLATTVPADCIAADDCNYVGCTSSRIDILTALKQCIDLEMMMTTSQSSSSTSDDGGGGNGKGSSSNWSNNI